MKYVKEAACFILVASHKFYQFIAP